MASRLHKYLQLLQQPGCWPALRHGVAATLEHDSALKREHFASVLDVGANKGQFATYARLRWPHARLICFEPLPEPRATLARVTRGQAEIHACALGAAAGSGEMHLASRVDSSSLLALGRRQKSLFGMDETGRLSVPIERLDAVITPPLARPSLLKIDVQGFELEVLKGATALLPEIDALYVEASDVELDEGQALHAEIERFLSDAGFRVEGCFNAQFDQGQRVQADWLFRQA